MQICSPDIASGATSANAVFPYCLLDCVSTWPLGLRKAKVVVRAHIEGLGGSSRQLKVEVMVVRLPINEGNVPAWNASYRAREAVIDSHLQAPHVEVVKVAVEGSITVPRLQVPIIFLPESL